MLAECGMPWAAFFVFVMSYAWLWDSVWLQHLMGGI